jgi:hypothetical protein
MKDALLLVSIPCKAMQMENIYEERHSPGPPQSPIKTEQGQAERPGSDSGNIDTNTR